MNLLLRSTPARTLTTLGLLATLGLSVPVVPAQAALVSVSDSANVAPPGIIADPTTLTLHLFDASLGVLKSVRVQFDAHASTGIIPSSVCSSACIQELNYDYSLSLADFAMGDIRFTGLVDRKTGTDTCTTTGPGLACLFRDLPSAQLTGDDTGSDAATLALFTGPGTFSLSFSSPGSPNPSTTAFATVTYVYDDGLTVGQVPEPGTLVMASFGLLGLLGSARARRIRRA